MWTIKYYIKHLNVKMKIQFVLLTQNSQLKIWVIHENQVNAWFI